MSDAQVSAEDMAKSSFMTLWQNYCALKEEVQRLTCERDQYRQIAELNLETVRCMQAETGEDVEWRKLFQKGAVLP